MIKLNLFSALRNFILVFGILFIFCFYAFSQSYHDCTDTEEFDDFLEQDISSEEMIDMMDLEFSKSLSKFDKCIDNNYLDTKNDTVRNQVFNVGFENHKVKELAILVDDIFSNQLKVESFTTDDNRSYHISSEKIKKILNFEPKYTISDAIKDLKFAFQNNLLQNSLNNPIYFNIEQLKKINLK